MSTTTGVDEIPAPAVAPPSQRAFRPDIQALRAYAVMAVVIYHFWPAVMPGGFVGVDVFFVISGYLITAHLMSEVDRTGTVRLGRFWARRIRRLLPASCLVLAVSLLALILFTPNVIWADNLRDIRASAAYVQNWMLARNAVDYLGAENDPGVAQHYWSLSAEEQFYVVWPILIVLAIGAKKLTGRRWQTRSVVAGLLGVVTLLSFALGVVLTLVRPAEAFFITPTRAWEFGVGGLVAVLGIGTRFRETTRAALGWVSVVVLLACAFLIQGHDVAFPGWIAAVPVLAAGAFITAGDSTVSWGPSRLYANRVLQWLGDYSYSIYLWHWPMVVLTPWIIRGEPGLVHQLAWLVLTLLLGWATKHLVEDPVRTSTWWSRRTWFAFAFALIVPGLLVAATTLLVRGVRADTADDAARASAAVDAGTACYGARAMADGCPDPFRRPADLDGAFAASDFPPERNACQVPASATENRICRYGREQDPALTVALVGNSHSLRLVPTLEQYGKSRGWQILLAAGTDCLGIDTTARGGQNEACAARARALPQQLQDAGVDVVVFAAHVNSAGILAGAGALGDQAALAQAEKATVATWKQYTDRGIKVLVTGDVPGTRPEFAPRCVLRPASPEDPCALPRSQVDIRGLMDVVADRNPGLVDHHPLAQNMCDETTCHAVVGGVVVYSDAHHLTSTYARTMADDLGPAVERTARG